MSKQIFTLLVVVVIIAGITIYFLATRQSKQPLQIVNKYDFKILNIHHHYADGSIKIEQGFSHFEEV